MRELKFNQKFYNIILSGNKTQTTRIKDKKFKVGEIVEAVFININEVRFDYKIPLKITKIVQKRYMDITSEDGENEGYIKHNNRFGDSAENQLKNELTNIYSNIHMDTIIYCYYFRIAYPYEVNKKDTWT